MRTIRVGEYNRIRTAAVARDPISGPVISPRADRLPVPALRYSDDVIAEVSFDVTDCQWIYETQSGDRIAVVPNDDAMIPRPGSPVSEMPDDHQVLWWERIRDRMRDRVLTGTGGCPPAG